MDLTIPCFDPALIARSGQCFRMCEGKGGVVTALAGPVLYSSLIYHVLRIVRL